MWVGPPNDRYCDQSDLKAVGIAIDYVYEGGFSFFCSGDSFLELPISLPFNLGMSVPD